MPRKKTKTIELHDWSIGVFPFGFCPERENKNICLFGKAVGHPRFEDNQEIITSNLAKFDADKMEAHTKSGSHYKLMKMRAGFDKAMADRGMTLKDYEGTYEDSKDI